MKKALVLGVALAVVSAVVLAGQYSGPFKELFGIRAHAELCMGADDDGVADASDNYLCVADEDLPQKAKDRVAGSIKYLLVAPDGFVTANGATARALKITGLDPAKFYQVKLDSFDSFEKDAFSVACPFPEQGSAWQCGIWNDGVSDIGFVVIATVKPDSRGVLTYNMQQPLVLPQGVYDDVNLVVTENDAPWRNVALGRLAFVVTG